MWKASKEIKYKKEVEEICKSMENRVTELCLKIERGDYNRATLPAFWLASQGDIDAALKKAKKQNKKYLSKNKAEKFRRIVMSKRGCIPIEQAIKEAQKRWPK